MLNTDKHIDWSSPIEQATRSTALVLSLLLIFTLPWRGALQFSGIGTIGRFIGAAAAIVWGINILFRQEIKYPSRLHLLLGVLVCWSAISYLWSIAPGQTIETTVRYVFVLGILVVIWDLFRTPTALELTFFAYILGAYLVVSAVFYNFILDSVVYMTRYTAFGLNPNIIARTLVIGTPLAGYLVVRPTTDLLATRIVRACNLLYITVAGVAIVLTGARQGMIGFGITIAFLAILSYQKRVSDNHSPSPFGRRTLATAAGLLMIAVAVGIYLVAVATNILTRLLLTPAEIASGEFGGRAPIWQAGLEIIKQRPLLGYGSGTFVPAIQPLFPEGEVPVAAHNAFIQLGVELGLVGAVIYTAILLVVAIAIYRQHTRYRELWMTLFAILLVLVLLEGIVANIVKYLIFMFVFLTATMDQNERLVNRSSSSEAPRIQLSTD